MSRNGLGTYALPSPPTPFSAGTTIVSADVNGVLTDIAAALTGSLAADGQTPMTGNLNMNTHAITGVTTISAAGGSFTGTVSYTASFWIANNVAVQAKDNGGVLRSVLALDSNNKVNQYVAGAVNWRVLNQAGSRELLAVSQNGQVTTDSVANWSANASLASSADSTARSWGLSAWAQNLAGVTGAISARVDATSQPLLALYYNGATAVGTITTNGSGVSYNSVSDQREKLDAGLFARGEAGCIVDALRPRWYIWKARPDAEPEPGFFAQQVHRVFPWAVTPGGGRRGRPSYRRWQMDAAKLVPVLVAELQELRRRVAALEAHADKPHS